LTFERRRQGLYSVIILDKPYIMHNARHIITGVANGLEWIYAYVQHARGIVFVPPLIGGHAVQQVRMLRRLLHRRFNIFSFNYAGHGQSEGRFCLRTSLDNTLHMLDLALGHGGSHATARVWGGLVFCRHAVVECSQNSWRADAQNRPGQRSSKLAIGKSSRPLPEFLAAKRPMAAYLGWVIAGSSRLSG
jgi:pimeloyl-ACP methyl ester carboxylesterase